MPANPVQLQNIRYATEENFALHVIKALNAVSRETAVDRRKVRDVIKKSNQISVRRIYDALVRLHLQGIIGFTSCKHSTHGYAVYLYYPTGRYT